MKYVPPEIGVPMTITDTQLVRVLEDVLPDLLVKKEGISPAQAKIAAKSLAWEIVQGARRCDEVYRVNDVSNKIMLNQPSRKECENFKAAVDEIIKIKRGNVNPQGRNLVKVLAGRIWYLLTERILGLPPEADDGPNVAVGERG